MRSAATIDLRQQSPRHSRGTFCADSVAPPEEYKQRGMTLVELLVVLALLVVIGSIVVPVFTGSFASVRLRRAGDQVLTRWSQARAQAIETGEVFQFTYTPETGSYQVGPWVSLVEDTAT